MAAGGSAAASAACLLPAAFLLLCAVAGGSGKQPVARGPHRNATLHVPAPLLQPAKPSADNVSITISPDVLRALADAEAARAEKLGSSASSGEMQTRMRDSIERIVEQVGAGWVRCVRCSGGAPWVLAAAPSCRLCVTPRMTAARRRICPWDTAGTCGLWGTAEELPLLAHHCLWECRAF